MTQVTINRLNGGFLFECEGHAGFAEKGKDIVCAAISALCMSLAERLAELADENVVRIDAAHFSDGEMALEVSFEDGVCAAKATETLETVRAGLETVERLYPDYLLIIQ